MSLLELQRGLKAHILHADSAVAPRLGGQNVEVRLSVYHRAYRAQLTACLRDAFDKTWAWLGDDAFDTAARAHIEAHPPHSWTLGDYGGDFPDTLRARYPDDLEVPELAWLDWTLRRAFDGPNAEPRAAEVLAGLDWEAAVLGFVPTLVVGEVSTNVAAIWGGLGEDQTPPPVEQLAQGAAIRVWRQGLSPQYRTITAMEAHAITLVRAARPFGAVCATLVETYPEAGEAIGPLLATWMQDGLLVAAV
jgi:hypothetical protein